MADDKRAEAMRKAIEESNAQQASEKKAASGGGSSDKLQQLKGQASKGAGVAVSKLKQLWGHKVGRIGLCAVAGVLVLLIAVSALSGITGKIEELPVVYEMTDAILCAYEDVSTGSGYAYDAYVEITNTGDSNIYAKDMSFMVQDEDGNRIMIDNDISAFPAIIAPGEKGYLFNHFGKELTGVYDPEMDLYLVPTYQILRAEATPHHYPVDNVQISQGAMGQKMTGAVTNDTAKEVSSMYVVGVCYNADGHCTGISGTFLQNVEPHVSVNVSFDPMTMIRAWRNEQVVDYMIYAY